MAHAIRVQYHTFAVKIEKAKLAGHTGHRAPFLHLDVNPVRERPLHDRLLDAKVFPEVLHRLVRFDLEHVLPFVNARNPHDVVLRYIGISLDIDIFQLEHGKINDGGDGHSDESQESEHLKKPMPFFRRCARGSLVYRHFLHLLIAHRRHPLDDSFRLTPLQPFSTAVHKTPRKISLSLLPRPVRETFPSCPASY